MNTTGLELNLIIHFECIGLYKLNNGLLGQCNRRHGLDDLDAMDMEQRCERRTFERGKCILKNLRLNRTRDTSIISQRYEIALPFELSCFGVVD